MKTFRWIRFRTILDNELTHILVHNTTRDGKEYIRLWGMLSEFSGMFISVCRKSQDLDVFVGVKDLLSLEDARHAVEKYLLDNGVIEEGDIVVYDS